MLADNRHWEARKHCADQEKKAQAECFNVLANAYLTINDHISAAKFYAKSGDEEKAKTYYLVAADKHLKKEYYDSAIKLYKLAGTTEDYYYTKIADSYAAHKEFLDATDYYERAGEKEKAKKYYEKLAISYLSKGYYKSSINFFKKAGKTKKYYFTKVAEFFIDRNNYESAAKYYEKAEDIASKEEYYLKAAEVYINKNDYKAAIRCYKKSGRSRIYYFTKIADAYLADGDYISAAEYYKKGGAPKKAKKFFTKLGDDYLIKGDYDAAIRFYRQAGKTRQFYFSKIAAEYVNQKKYAQAAKYYDWAKDNKNAKKNYIKLADTYFNNGDYDSAVKFYTKGGIAKINFYLKVADVYLAKNDYIAAAKYYEKAKDKNNAKKNYLKLADIYFAKNDYDSAAKFYTKAGIPTKDYYTKIALLYLDKKNYPSAAHYYDKAGNRKKSRIYHIKSADNYHKAGNYKSAAKHYAKAKSEISIENFSVSAAVFIDRKKHYEASIYYGLAAEYYENLNDSGTARVLRLKAEQQFDKAFYNFNNSFPEFVELLEIYQILQEKISSNEFFYYKKISMDKHLAAAEAYEKGLRSKAMLMLDKLEEYEEILKEFHPSVKHEGEILWKKERDIVATIKKIYKNIFERELNHFADILLTKYGMAFKSLKGKNDVIINIQQNEIEEL